MLHELVRRPRAGGDRLAQDHDAGRRLLDVGPEESFTREAVRFDQVEPANKNRSLGSPADAELTAMAGTLRQPGSQRWPRLDGEGGL